MKISQWPFWYAFWTALTLMAFELVLFTPFFHVTDDVQIIFLTKGIGISLHPDEHYLVSNILMGHALKFLYGSFPKLAWYSYYLLSTQFLAWWSFLTVIYSRPNRLQILFFLSCFLSVDLYYFSNLNFTMTSALVCQGGIFLLTQLFEEGIQLPRGKTWSLAGICLLSSFWMRPEAFLLSIVIALPLMVHSFKPRDIQPKDLAAFSLIGFMLLASLGFNGYCYQKAADWGLHSHMTAVIRENHEYRQIEYTPATIGFFKDIGWSRNDFDLFKEWCFIDQDKFSEQKMNDLGQHFPQGNTGQVVLFSNLLRPGVIQDLALLFLLFLLFSPVARIKSSIFLIGWVTVVVLFLAFKMKIEDRIVMPQFSFILHLLILRTASFKTPHRPEDNLLLGPLKRATPLFVLFLLVLSGLALSRFQMDNSQKKKLSDDFKTAVTRLDPQNKQLYVVWELHFPYQYLNALDDFEIYRHFHIFGLGAYQTAPVAREMLYHFKLKDPFLNMVDNPNIFMVCTPYEGLLYHQYMLEKYGMNIRAQKVFDSIFFRVFQIHKASGR